MKVLNIKYLKLFFLFGLMSYSLNSPIMGQDTNIQQSRTKTNWFKKKITQIDTTIHKFKRDTLPPTRDDIENHRLLGLVVSDVKGISLQIGGFIQADFIYDFNEMTTRDGFQTASIDVPTNHMSGTDFSVRQTRLNFSATGPTQFGNFYALLEFDLSNPDGTTNPRMRHAWISLGKWGFGQYYSNFTDNNTWPNLIDSWGPNAAILRRQVQIRYTQPLNKYNSLAFSLEQPGADVTFPEDSVSWSVRTLYPDITGSYTLTWADGNSHIKLSGLLHPITYSTSNDNNNNIVAGAVNIAGNIQVIGRDALKFQTSYGTGYARYNEDIGGMGYDAIPNPSKNYQLESIVQRYFWVFYDHWWSKRFSSTFGWGHVKIDKKNYFPPTDIDATNYVAANLLWYPNKFFKTGIEFLYGTRKNHNHEIGENFRIQYSAFVRL